MAKSQAEQADAEHEKVSEMSDTTENSEAVEGDTTTPQSTEKISKDAGAIVVEAKGEVFTSFEEASFHPKVIEGIAKAGWKEPTPVQGLCLPHTMRGRDVAGFAQTGTGKTGVFLLTLANQLLNEPSERKSKQPRAIVLAPTRELAIQIQHDAEDFLDFMGFKSLAVYGGADYDKQARAIKDGIDVIMATPGRLKDFTQKKIVDLSACQTFVCDEVDRMFDMGFIEDVEYFLNRLPEKGQRLIFSATTNDEVKELAFEYLDNPEYISVNPEVLTPESIDQHAIHVEATHKLQVLLGLIRDHKPECAIIFTNTKIAAEWLHFKLIRNGVEADLITGDLPQKKRINLIHRIKEGKVKGLIATDVASRGLHISRVSHVYNFDLPDEAANYIHRIGRTARAGAKGSSYSLVCDDYGHNLSAINELLGEELALRSEWFDQNYLQIKDEAGDFFAEVAEKKAAERPKSPAARSRGGRQGASSKEDRGGGGGRSGGKGRRDDRSRSAKGNRSDQDRGGRSGEGRKRGGSRRRGQKAGESGGQGRSRGQGRSQKSQGRSQGQSAAAAEGQGQSVGGILKKLARVFFGLKK